MTTGWSGRAAGLCVVILAASCDAAPATPDWLADLNALARDLPRKHAAPETERPLAEFEADVARVRARIPSLGREAILTEFIRLAATFGDSHTEIPIHQPALGFHRMPLGLYMFGDELRVLATDADHEGLLGARLVSIGDHPVAQAFSQLRPLLSEDFGNPHEILHSGPIVLTVPEILAGVGLATPGAPIPFTFEGSDGVTTIATFPGLSFDGAARAMTVRLHAGENGPLFTRRRDLWNHMDRQDGPGLLYVRVSRSADQEGQEPLSALARRLVREAEGKPVGRAAIDLRQNTGGNFHTTEPLAKSICEAKRAGRIGEVYVILGRHTYSAAVTLAAGLRHDCGARFVGETPRAVPNHQGEMERFTLPGSRIEVTYSSKFYRLFPELGEAAEIPLELPAPMTWADYRDGKDAALQSIVAAGGP